MGYYGQNEVGIRKGYNIGADYTAYLGMENKLPTWVIKETYDMTKRTINAFYYPYFRTRNITQHKLELKGSSNIYTSKSHYEIGLNAEFAKGSDLNKKDGTQVQPSEENISPQSVDYAQNQEFEYLTAQQLRCGVDTKNEKKIKATSIIGYCLLNYNLAIAQNIQYLSGKAHHQLSVTLGCRF